MAAAVLITVFGAVAVAVFAVRARRAEEDAADDRRGGRLATTLSVVGAGVLGGIVVTSVRGIGDGVGADSVTPIVVGTLAAGVGAFAGDLGWAASERRWVGDDVQWIGPSRPWGSGRLLGVTSAERAWTRLGGLWYTDGDDGAEPSVMPPGCTRRPGMVIGSAAIALPVLVGADQVNDSSSGWLATLFVLIGVGAVGIAVARMGRLRIEKQLHLTVVALSGVSLALVTFAVLDAALEPDGASASAPTETSVVPDGADGEPPPTTTTSLPEPLAPVIMPPSAYELQIQGASIEGANGVEQYEIDDLDVDEPRAAVQVADGGAWFDLGPGIWDASQCVGLFATGSDVAAAIAGPGCDALPASPRLEPVLASAVVADHVIVSEDGTDVAFPYDLPDATDDFQAVVLIPTPGGLVFLEQATSVFDLPPAGAVDFPETEVGDIVPFEANLTFEAFLGEAIC